MAKAKRMEMIEGVLRLIRKGILSGRIADQTVIHGTHGTHIQALSAYIDNILDPPKPPTRKLGKRK